MSTTAAARAAHRSPTDASPPAPVPAAGGHGATAAAPSTHVPTLQDGNVGFDEMTAGLELPSPMQTARLFGRAFILRCPSCGKGPVLQHWLKLRVRCGSCGIRTERGEHDYFIGAIFILFTLAGILVIGTLAVTLIVAWPDVPWDLLQFGLPIMMALSMPALYPLSKLVWLAFDLMLRPVTSDELQWHRSARQEYSSERNASRD